MAFSAAPSRGGWVGLGLVAAASAVWLGLLVWIGRAGPSPQGAVLGFLALGMSGVVAAVAYRAWGHFSLRYTTSRDGVAIRYAASEQIVPIGEITHVLSGRPYSAELAGWRWPGSEVGRTEFIDNDGQTHPLLVYATQPPEAQLILLTPGLAYAISPADRKAFIEDFRMRQRLGPVQVLSQHTATRGLARLTLWRDSWALGALGLGLLVNAVILAGIAWRYPSLPAELALRFQYDPITRLAVDGPLRPRPEVWTLPAIGLAILAANGIFATAIHGRSRLAAMLLLTGAVIVQVALILVLRHIG